MTFVEDQRRRRAAGLLGTADLLDRLEAQNPALREYAEWIIDAPVDAGRSPDPVRLAAELRDAVLAHRTVNARRELGQVGAFLAEQPDHPAARRWRERFVELTAFVVRAERSGTLRPRPWAELLAREASLAPRRPRGAR